jgi:hypothetical protein
MLDATGGMVCFKLREAQQTLVDYEPILFPESNSKPLPCLLVIAGEQKAQSF